MKYLNNTFFGMISLLFISGCAVTPKQLDSLGQDDGAIFKRTSEVSDAHLETLLNFEQQAPTSKALVQPSSQTNETFGAQVITRGDVLRMRINGMPQFEGLYQVNVAGELEVPFSKSLSVNGLSRQQAIAKIEEELIEQKWLYRDMARVDVSIVELATVNVSVSGAVFNPGQVSVNNQPIEKPKDPIPQLSGAFSSGRDLTAAIMAAGGVRPDADLNSIFIKRGANIISVSLTAMMSGSSFIETPSVINGDQILVGSSGIENTTYIKPSGITPPGMRIFMSNLIAPSLSNSQAAVGADSTRMPYGSSLIEAAISANCMGGTQQANASRSVILVTHNYGSTKQIAVMRSIDQLLANSSNYSVNPYVMPNDALACYDSRFTNFRDIARGLGDLISPLLLASLL